MVDEDLLLEVLFEMQYGGLALRGLLELLDEWCLAEGGVLGVVLGLHDVVAKILGEGLHIWDILLRFEESMYIAYSFQTTSRRVASTS
jgi:hypothetical protein